MDIKICKPKICCTLPVPISGDREPFLTTNRTLARLSYHFVYSGLALLGSLTACHPPTPPPLDTLVMALASNPTQLDPRFASDAFSGKVGGLIFGSLLRRNQEGVLGEETAEHLAQTDPQTLVVTLRPDRRFSDGTPLTAKDVKATFDFVKDPAHGAVRQGSLAAVERIEAPDDHTVIFHLKHPYAPFRESLTLGILPERLARAEKPSDGRPESLVGSGPYRLTRYSRDESIELTANPFAATPPRTPRLKFKIVPDASVRALELVHGSVDLIQNDLPAYLTSWLATQPDIRLSRKPSTMTRYLTLNPNSSPLNNPQVRQAIAQAIDPQALVEGRLRGLASRANSILPPTNFAHDRNLQGYAYSPAQAKAMLDAAGFPDPPGSAPRFSLLYKTSQDETGAAVARIFQAQLRQVGISVTVQTNEWGVFFGDISRGNFQVYCLTAVGVNDPDYLAFLFGSDRMPPNGGNRARYTDTRMDATLTCGQTTLEEAPRRQCYAEAQRLAQEATVYIPLWYEENVALMRSNLLDYAVSPTGDFQALARAYKRPSPAETSAAGTSLGDAGSGLDRSGEFGAATAEASALKPMRTAPLARSNDVEPP